MDPKDAPTPEPLEPTDKLVTGENAQPAGIESLNVGDFSVIVVGLIDAGDQASRKSPEYAKLLTDDQKARALGLGVPPEKIESLGYLIGLCKSTLKTILDSETGVEGAMQFLNSISIAFASQQPLKIEKDEIPKEELEKLISIIFSEENIRYGVPYILSYFLGFHDASLEEQTISFRVLTGLLDYWRRIGKNHDQFGVVGNEYGTNMAVFERYTAYVDDRYWYFSVPLLSKQKKVETVRYGISSYNDIPDTFARIGMNDGTETDIEIDVGHYETIYILGGMVYRYLRPAVRGLRGFIKKHQAFLSMPGNAPWEQLKTGEEKAWQGAKKLLEIQVAQKDTKEPVVTKTPPQAGRKNKGQMRPPVVPTPSAGPILNTQATTFPTPKLRETLRETLGNGSTPSEIPPSLICSNIPEGAMLCIGRRASRGGGKTLEWDSKKYKHDKLIPFYEIYPGESIEYYFCFLGEQDSRVPGKSLPHTTLSLRRPKERWIPDIETGVQGIKKDVPGKVADTLDGGKPDAPPPPLEVKVEDSPTDICAYAILSDTSQIRISRRESDTILITVVGLDGFELEYRPDNQTFAGAKLPAGVEKDALIAVLTDELKTQIDSFLALESEEHTKLVAGKLAFAYIFIGMKFAEMGDISKFQTIDAFVLTRTREGSGAFVFTPKGNPKYRRFVDFLRAQFLEEYGIYFQISETSGEEVQITLSLKEEEGISATITSKNPPPPPKQTAGIVATPNSTSYYEISDLSHLESTIREQMTETLIHLFLFLGAAGRSLSQEGKISTPSGYTMDRGGVVALYQRGFKSIAESGPSREKDERERALEFIRKMQEGAAIKSCAGVELVEIAIPGTPKKEKVPIYDISTRKNGESKKLLLTGSDDVKLIYRDECLAFMSSGAGHANVYERIRVNTRLQKYLALRMAYAINPKLCYDEIKDPLPDFAARFLLGAWSKVPTAIQGEFLACFEKGSDGRVAKAIEVEMNPGTRVFGVLLESLEESGIKILHHSPGFVPLGKIREYKRLMDASSGK